MSRTFSARRAWISKEIPSVEQVTEKYPALMLTTMVRSEFHSQTGICLLGTLQDVFSMTSTKIIEVAKKKHHLEHFFASLDEAMSAAQPLHKDLKLTASVRVLSSLVKERMEAFISPYLESIKIDEDGLVPALATHIALYWAFDIVFAPKAQKTFDLICRMVGINSGVRPTPLLRVAHTLQQ
ncbi:uncharacterized protein LOC125941336 [Dermacentor silvarum]|uniref:uncharacterized protein LOC125941336 n=1 Tax=Dermacentor silvarum TaxID=543639 RepID=UPI0021010069|nr:uncharacterized protein LOC125941336 [Dermacentor silvarum]